MADAAQAPELKQAFTEHREETVRHTERLEQVFERLGIPAKAVVCEAIKGLIEEGEEVIKGSEPGPVRDAGLVACGQAVEHYEIARYGALIAWSEASDHHDVATLLRRTLDEEKKADKLLNELATSRINRSAAATAKGA